VHIHIARTRFVPRIEPGTNAAYEYRDPGTTVMLGIRGKF